MKLYWRVKKKGKWTFVPAIIDGYNIRSGIKTKSTNWKYSQGSIFNVLGYDFEYQDGGYVYKREEIE